MSKPNTLSQWVGVRKGVSQRATSKLTVLHRESAKAAPYAGLSKKYRPVDEDSEHYPDEKKKVVMMAEQVLSEAKEIESDWWDVLAACEYGNQTASANLCVEGTVLIQEAPVGLLLFLDKRFKDLRTFVEKMPVLDQNEDWTQDPTSGLFKTEKQTTHKTALRIRPIVKYDATKEHPAQTELLKEQAIIGWWDTVKSSGAMTVPRQRQLLARLDALIRAVKFAVEAANTEEVSAKNVGDPVLSWLLRE